MGRLARATDRLVLQSDGCAVALAFRFAAFRFVRFWLFPVFCVAALSACDGDTVSARGPGSSLSLASLGDVRGVAVEFARALAARDYAAAHAMLTPEYAVVMTQEALRSGFEALIPPSWRIVGSIETMEDAMVGWPGRRLADAGWSYITIPYVDDERYDDFDAVSIVVTDAGGELKIREIEWGRAD